MMITASARQGSWILDVYEEESGTYTLVVKRPEFSIQMGCASREELDQLGSALDSLRDDETFEIGKLFEGSLTVVINEGRLWFRLRSEGAELFEVAVAKGESDDLRAAVKLAVADWEE